MKSTDEPDRRLHALDALRGFALLLGVAFHAALSFMPGWPPGLWAMKDSSPSQALSDAAFVSHVFRMSLFFFIAGFFARRLHQKRGTRGFWANRLARILVPLVAGWAVLFPAIGAVWSWGMHEVFGGEPPPMPPMPSTPGAFPLMHLWFLYQLLLIYAGFLALRAVVTRWDREHRLRAAVDSALEASLRLPIAVLVLGIPLACALARLPTWFYWEGIPTPDRSLVPQLPASVGYGTAFVFGWLVQRSSGALPTIARRWWLHLPLGALATAWLLRAVHTEPMAQPGLTKLVCAVVFGVAVWGWVLGLTGAALRFLSSYAARRRYVADASYWIYLVHLPVVAALQVWVGHWPLHWSLKFPFILVVSLALLFASYHVLVRPTFLGQLLNGRRYSRRGPHGASQSLSAAEPSAQPSAQAAASDRGVVAELRVVTKRFGATTALAGIDLEVRPGELLAVLGPNGAGKSTAVSLWLGLIEADAGEVRLLGGSPLETGRRQRLGVMLQNVELPKELRVRELVALASSYYDDPLPVEESLRRACIAQLADQLYGKLSGGQKRLAQFAVAICGQPRVLFLDEPTVGLDIEARAGMWANLRSLTAAGCSIVLTTHYLEEAEALAQRVAVISRGRLIAMGSVDEMRSLVARRQIGCDSELPLETVRAWPGVIDVRRENGRLHIGASDAESVVRRLLEADARLRGLEVRRAGLNEAFTELTREAA